MYRRFLINSDYYGVITPETLNQLTRGREDCFIQAEQSAEMSLREYLSENYEIEAELNKGMFIADYDRMITYPSGVFIHYENSIYEVIRSISGYKAPALSQYWEVYTGVVPEQSDYPVYSQFATYRTEDIVEYNGEYYLCLRDNGFKFDNIRIPMVNGWRQVNAKQWLPVDYELWDVVLYEGEYYTLMSKEGFDNNLSPASSDCWGAIADYDCTYNEYDLSGHDYVVHKGKVFVPETDVNADTPEIGVNLAPGDPRNYNLKKHMVRLAIYELTKLIAPNNVSIVRVRDYEDSMRWLADASKLRLNPQIPRRLAEDSKPVMDWQLATFQTSYDPWQNPWMI